MRHLAVDAGMQGRGVGSAAVALVVAHVTRTRPDCEQVRLTVHPEDERAQRVYRSSGFLPSGQLRDGEPIWLLDLKPGGMPAGNN